jgi:hypothetical protein
MDWKKIAGYFLELFMGTTGRIQEVVSSLKGRQQPAYRKDVSRSAIPKLNSPVALVSTDLTCSHTLCEKTL